MSKLRPLAVFALSSCALVASPSPVRTWNDSTRDVWINGELDRGTHVLSCKAPARIALISDRLPNTIAIVIDTEAHRVSTAAREAFVFAPDGASATTNTDLALEPVCDCQSVDGATLILSWGGRTILIGPHQGRVGEMTEEQLFSAVPVWRSLMEAYEPAADAVAALKAYPDEADLTVVFGTWCGDSKNHVPKLLAALHRAANPKLRVKLVGLKARFAEPLDFIQKNRVINVPTVVVTRGARELGRFVETPGGKSVEEDLAAVLAGKPNAHNGRWERKERLAAGTYLVRDREDRLVGTERWELYATAENGLLLHSLNSHYSGSDTADVEVWHEVDEKRRPSFLEVTKRAGEQLERARYSVEDGKLTGSLRGSDSGITTQTLCVPVDMSLLSPAVAAMALSKLPAKDPGNREERAVYRVPGEVDKPIGLLREVVSRSEGTETVRVPAGEYQALRVSREVSGEARSDASEWWLHPQLGVPVRGRTADGREVVLASLEWGAAVSAR